MKKSATLWQMLCWAYGRQLVHRYLRAPSDWLEWMYAMEFATEGDVKRPTVARDAALLHAAVTELDQHAAMLLAMTAIDGQQPVPSAREPRPQMIDQNSATRDDRIVGGRGIRYVVRVMERISVSQPIIERVGRRSYKVVGQQLETVDVMYCPVQWEPDLDWFVAIQQIHRDWFNAMSVLYAAVQDLDFSEHQIIGIGIDVEAPTSAVAGGTAFSDSFAQARGASEVSEAPKLIHDDTCIPYFGSDGYQLLRRRIRAVN